MRIGITGHQGLNSFTRRAVTISIAELLAEQPGGDLIGITSLAEGADQLFAFTVLAAGGRLHVIIPSSGYEHSFDGDPEAGANYAALRGLASDVDTLPFTQPGEGAYLAAGKAIVNNCDLLIAVWDGHKAAGKGGTGDIVQYATNQGVRRQIIWPHGAQRT